jgi:hypothetical protein
MTRGVATSPRDQGLIQWSVATRTPGPTTLNGAARAVNQRRELSLELPVQWLKIFSFFDYLFSEVYCSINSFP